MNIKEGISGIIVPQWKISSGSSEFIFAIDFGTSNTHIEYAIVGSKVSEPFDISYKDRQLYKLNEYLLANTIFNNDYIPAEINQSSQSLSNSNCFIRREKHGLEETCICDGEY